ncbi:MAG TPA: helix-turn-helix transcriptional regulator [Bryobacteraceae bacterium]|nr:helix-turn-helix transcriptional regulator [Bryobacteraceae bacterium]
MTFGKLLREARVRAGKNVKQAARDAGTSWGYWYEMERDLKCPTVKMLPSLANAVGCDAADLIPSLESTQKNISPQSV